MSAEIVADESVDFAIVRTLRSSGISVISIAEDNPGWPDTKVLELAYTREAFLITEDKDFGELSYRFKRPSHGILLIRLIQESSAEKAAIVLDVMQANFDQLWGSFSVLESAKLRIRPL